MVISRPTKFNYVTDLIDLHDCVPDVQVMVWVSTWMGGSVHFVSKQNPEGLL